MYSCFIASFLDLKVLELGTFKGHTTRVLSFLFKEVWTIDNQEDFIDDAKHLLKEMAGIFQIVDTLRLDLDIGL